MASWAEAGASSGGRACSGVLPRTAPGGTGTGLVSLHQQRWSTPTSCWSSSISKYSSSISRSWVNLGSTVDVRRMLWSDWVGKAEKLASKPRTWVSKGLMTSMRKLVYLTGEGTSGERPRPRSEEVTRVGPPLAAEVAAGGAPGAGAAWAPLVAAVADGNVVVDDEVVCCGIGLVSAAWALGTGSAGGLAVGGDLAAGSSLLEVVGEAAVAAAGAAVGVAVAFVGVGDVPPCLTPLLLAAAAMAAAAAILPPACAAVFTAALPDEVVEGRGRSAGAGGTTGA
ncbi:hypothetical protein V8C86DRAFT_2476234 [Haematococcus lacustris]